jgi:hypothetical protein
MTTDEMVAARGRKVVFLYPHSVLNEELLVEILQNEYEIYTLRDHDAAVRVAAAWPGSIIFVNIDEALNELQWEMWIRHLMEARETASTRVGIMTYNPNPDLARKYLMELMIPCGFIQLKLGLAEGKRIILKTLEANEARGRRRYVRARCLEKQKATFNVSIRETYHTGSILDISVAGMTFRFDDAVNIKLNTQLNDVQLRMKGTLCRVSGKYVGAVRSEPDRNLLMFDIPLADEPRIKIHRFIFNALQDELGEFLKSHGESRP